MVLNNFFLQNISLVYIENVLKCIFPYFFFINSLLRIVCSCWKRLFAILLQGACTYFLKHYFQLFFVLNPLGCLNAIFIIYLIIRTDIKHMKLLRKTVNNSLINFLQMYAAQFLWRGHETLWGRAKQPQLQNWRQRIYSKGSRKKVPPLRARPLRPYPPPGPLELNGHRNSL